MSQWQQQNVKRTIGHDMPSRSFQCVLPWLQRAVLCLPCGRQQPSWDNGSARGRSCRGRADKKRQAHNMPNLQAILCLQGGDGAKEREPRAIQNSLLLHNLSRIAQQQPLFLNFCRYLLDFCFVARGNGCRFLLCVAEILGRNTWHLQ